MGRRETRERHEQVVRGLQEERAAALVRISRTLDSLIEQLHAARARLAQAAPSDREREAAACRELRERALLYRWYLEVQREAIGIRGHHRLDEFYPIPPADL